MEKFPFPLPEPEINKFPLLPSWKNKLLKIIEGLGLNPSDFQWSDVTSKNAPELFVPKLAYRDTDFYFIFDISEFQDARLGIYSPGEHSMVEFLLMGDKWEGTRKSFIRWLSYLQKEINEPDLWERIQEYSLPINSQPTSHISNESFTHDEIKQIITGITEVKGYILEHIENSHEHE